MHCFSTCILSRLNLLVWFVFFPSKLLKSLPDKGKKIIKYIEQVRLAIQYHDEEEKRLSAARTKLSSKLPQDRGASRETAAVTMEMSAAAASDDSDLVLSLGMMSVSDKDADLWRDTDPIRTTNIPEENNYFFKTHENKKLHCLNVLGKIESTNPARKQKFQTNQ